MIENLTPFDLANDIRMLRNHDNIPIVVFEGGSDNKVYSNFFNKGRFHAVISHGKTNGIGAISILNRENFEGLLAIIDTDFDKLDNRECTSMNILSTDFHDLETMIINSSAFEHNILELADSNKMHLLNPSPLDHIIKNCRIIGAFKWLSSVRQQNLRLTFKEIDFTNFVDINTLEINCEDLIKVVKQNSVNYKSFDEKLLETEILQIVNNSQIDSWQLCSGHDLVYLFLLSIKHIIGNSIITSLTYELFDSIIRLSYSFLYFNKTKLYSDIVEWEKTNSSYKVLAIDT